MATRGVLTGSRVFLLMSRILPPARPKRELKDLQAVLNHFKLDGKEAVLVFVRGYYLDSMGAPDRNDRNIYDDAVFLIGPGVFESWNANTDPSFARDGGRALATLNLGLFQFYRGKHKGRYPALRSWPEGVRVDVTREGKPSTAVGINIHKGSTSSRSRDVVWSEGCLTIPDIQWPDFIARVYGIMKRLGQNVIEVAVVENRETAAGQRLFSHEGKQIN